MRHKDMFCLFNKPELEQEPSQYNYSGNKKNAANQVLQPQKDEASGRIMEPAHPDVLIPMPDIELYDNTNTIKHEESKSKEQMERHSCSGGATFHWRLSSQLCVEQPPIPSHPQFILHSSLGMLLLPVPYERKPRIRLFSCGKDRVFLGWCQDWPWDGSTHRQHGKHIRKGWLKHVCKMSTWSHFPKISPRAKSFCCASHGPGATEALLLWHRILPTAFPQSQIQDWKCKATKKVEPGKVQT